MKHRVADFQDGTLIEWDKFKSHAANVGAKFEHESGEVIHKLGEVIHKSGEVIHKSGEVIHKSGEVINKISGEPNIFVSLLS
jgi:hypothetical protein